jgi:hypothetical protein
MSETQKELAEKALRMKKEGETPTHIPEHQTSHEGGVHGQQFQPTDRDAGSEGSHQPQLKRSQVARSGDS